MADVAIDTDVASRIQKGTEPAWVRHHVVGARTWLTFVTVGELWKWAELIGQGSENSVPFGSADCAVR